MLRKNPSHRTKIMGPINPKVANKVVPEEVYECFNTLIQERIADGEAIVNVSEVVEMLIKKGFTKKDIFDKKMLDIEESYTQAGWKVEYDRPGYNESGEAHFIFTRKRNARFKTLKKSPEQLIKELRSHFESMSDSQREEFHKELMEGYCRACAHVVKGPCLYCSE